MQVTKCQSIKWIINKISNKFGPCYVCVYIYTELLNVITNRLLWPCINVVCCCLCVQLINLIVRVTPVVLKLKLTNYNILSTNAMWNMWKKCPCIIPVKKTTKYMNKEWNSKHFIIEEYKIENILSIFSSLSLGLCFELTICIKWTRLYRTENILILWWFSQICKSLFRQQTGHATKLKTYQEFISSYTSFRFWNCCCIIGKKSANHIQHSWVLILISPA